MRCLVLHYVDLTFSLFVEAFPHPNPPQLQFVPANFSISNYGYLHPTASRQSRFELAQSPSFIPYPTASIGNFDVHKPILSGVNTSCPAEGVDGSEDVNSFTSPELRTINADQKHESGKDSVNKTTTDDQSKQNRSNENLNIISK